MYKSPESSKEYIERRSKRLANKSKHHKLWAILIRYPESKIGWINQWHIYSRYESEKRAQEGLKAILANLKAIKIEARIVVTRAKGGDGNEEER